jgi:X-X-X-Leu-X-X-Gly heptad repeat protein
MRFRAGDLARVIDGLEPQVTTVVFTGSDQVDPSAVAAVVNDLADGANDLADGANDLADGANDVAFSLRKATDAIKMVDDGCIEATVDRSLIRLAVPPVAADRSALERAIDGLPETELIDPAGLLSGR